MSVFINCLSVWPCLSRIYVILDNSTAVSTYPLILLAVSRNVASLALFEGQYALVYELFVCVALFVSDLCYIGQ